MFEKVNHNNGCLHFLRICKSSNYFCAFKSEIKCCSIWFR